MSKAQPGDLRSRVIRLAHERADLRPHLLAVLAEDATGRTKEAWGMMPRDAYSFGYEGPNSAAVGRAMAGEVQQAVQRTRKVAAEIWKGLATRLVENAALDAQPGLSRTVVALALRDTYEDLHDKVEAYFESIPTP